MDRLGALSMFAKVVETGSFSEAGRQSGMAPSSVSRSIQELEAWVGAALFHRTTRRVALTETGRSFHGRTRDILLDLEEARVMAARLENHPSGLIRLTGRLGEAVAVVADAAAPGERECSCNACGHTFWTAT